MEMYIGSAIRQVNFRQAIYSGALFLHSNLTAAHDLCGHALSCAAQIFGASSDLRTIHKSLKVEEFACLVSELKAIFTNSERAKTIIRAFIVEIEEDPTEYLFDVPRIRVVPHYEYLHAGVSYAYKPHRDTWYGGPSCQINTWMPLFPITPSQTMMINPDYFARGINNTSENWSLKDWVNNQRIAALNNIREETRIHPVPLETIDSAGEIKLAGSRGDMVIFSGAHLHGTVPNFSDLVRFSVDFRVIHIDDLKCGRGAQNVDSACKDVEAGYKDYFRASDFARFLEIKQ
jgi:hypothetical protein